VPEIADYELRRELIRAEKAHGIQRLDVICEAFGLVPLTTAVMRAAAQLWADAHNRGGPTAHDSALDGDVILAAQARAIAAEQDAEPVVATTNAKHLGATPKRVSGPRSERRVSAGAPACQDG
jgi:predicted nucleic acid-binding protein